MFLILLIIAPVDIPIEPDPITIMVSDIEKRIQAAKLSNCGGIAVNCGKIYPKAVSERLMRKGYIIRVEEVYPTVSTKSRFPTLSHTPEYRLLIRWK